MELALDKTTKQKISPTKGAKGICQACGAELIAKCGKIKIHHWSHKICCTDLWWSPETEWHRTWKSHFPLEWREFKFICEKTGEKHIADIYSPRKKLVIEFQNSQIDISEIESRESFYKKMIWVINKELLPIQIFPLEILIPDLTEQYASFINERINDALPLSRIELESLYSYRDKLLNCRKKGSFNYEFNKIITRFNRIIEEVILTDTFNNPLILKPSRVKRDITSKLLEIATMDINSYIEKNHLLPETSQYFSYKQKHLRSIWNFSKEEVFIDNGLDLFWLVSDRILKKVPKEEFISKYSITF